jgi:proteasome lid subunit RPN8/RPN11
MRRADWDAMLAELSRRGHGQIESGAFLLARRPGDSRRVTRVVYYDDLDPDCLVGGIHFHGLAYGKLWALCRSDGLTVVGDVHTHPSACVQQSDIDKGSPMVAQEGHMAVIVPHFAHQPTDPAHVGVHVYDGQGWTTWTGRDAAARLFVRRFV